MPTGQSMTIRPDNFKHPIAANTAQSYLRFNNSFAFTVKIKYCANMPGEVHFIVDRSYQAKYRSN